MRDTHVLDGPKTTRLEEEVGIHQIGRHHVGRDTEYGLTILLPPGAKLLSTDSRATVDKTQDGHTKIRYEFTALDDQKYRFIVHYELPAATDEAE